jgi:hypothetical protein
MSEPRNVTHPGLVESGFGGSYRGTHREIMQLFVFVLFYSYCVHSN